MSLIYLTRDRVRKLLATAQAVPAAAISDVAVSRVVRELERGNR